MAWEDKTFEAKYTSPSGKEFIFLYEEKVSRETELKTGVFTFPDKDGAHVQHQGAGAVSFPLTCIFTGPDCMDTADEFEAALFERDVAELQHPAYGTVKVIPTGNIKREDDLVNALNESRVTVTFTETITADNATPMETVSADEINETLEEFSESAALDFAESISADTVAEELQLRSALAAQVQLLDDAMMPIVESDSAALANYKTMSAELKEEIKGLKRNSTSIVISDIKNNVKKAEDYVVKGLNIARSDLNLMKLPSRTGVDIMEKIKGYSLLISKLSNQFKNDPYGIKNVINAFKSTNLVLSGCMASLASGTAIAMAVTAIKADKTVINRTPAVSPSSDGAVEIPASSREESVQTVNNLLNNFEKVKSFYDSKAEKNFAIDSDSNSFLLLNKVVYLSIQLIMNTALLLPMRRTITLNQNRQIIELVCELYGSVDYIDKFIADNDLSIDDMEVLPMGREVTYYVQAA